MAADNACIAVPPDLIDWEQTEVSRFALWASIPIFLCFPSHEQTRVSASATVCDDAATAFAVGDDAAAAADSASLQTSRSSTRRRYARSPRAWKRLMKSAGESAPRLERSDAT